jgi:acetyl/propionyl-CoA carboxylase alpha subunit
LDEFAFPEGCSGLRVDTHLAAGSRIGTHYDSLLAKVILHRPDRDACIDGLLEFLDGIAILGVATTADLHRRVLAHEDFRRGATDTRWLEGMLAAGS